MSAEEFVKEISDLRPSRTELHGLDHSDGLLNNWLKEFVITKGTIRTDINPIKQLVNSYELNSLNINDITFDNDCFDDGELVCFGWDATGDRLAIHKSSGKIVAYDVYGDRMTFQCAENSERFLDALVEIMKFWKEKILNDYDEEYRNKRSVEVAYVAALKAGGEDYEPYYKSILWVE